MCYAGRNVSEGSPAGGSSGAGWQEVLSGRIESGDIAYDLNGQETYIRAQAYYIYNCADSTRLVGVGVPLERLRLKIEDPPSWARFPYLGPDYVGPSIMFKGRIDGCDAYKDNEIRWRFDFYYQRE